MKTGIIDIGTNTIRLSVYNSNAEEIFTKSISSTILENTDYGVLTQKGIEELTHAVEALSQLAAVNGCERVCAFATSALRSCKNCVEVAKACKVEIEILSPEEEAYCDYLGLRKELGSKRGVGVDLGGGSCQFFVFDENNVTFSVSEPIGVKRLKKAFVSGEIQTHSETDAITEEIGKVIPDEISNAESLTFIGGSAKSAAKMFAALADRKNSDEILVSDIEKLFDTPDLLQHKNMLISLCQKRYDTVLVGLTVILAVCKKCGTDKTAVSTASVRDGFLYKIIERNDINE